MPSDSNAQFASTREDKGTREKYKVKRVAQARRRIGEGAEDPKAF